MLVDKLRVSIDPYADGRVVIDDARGERGVMCVCPSCGAVSVEPARSNFFRCPLCCADTTPMKPAKTAVETASELQVPIAAVPEIEAVFDSYYFDLADFEAFE